MQDGATCHTTDNNLSFLMDKFNGRVISNKTEVIWTTLTVTLLTSSFGDMLCNTCKGYELFVGQKTQCPQIYIKFTQFKVNDSRKLFWKYYLLRAVVAVEKWVKQCHELNFRLSDQETKIILACKTYFHDIFQLISKKLQHLSNQYFKVRFLLSLSSKSVSLM